MYRSKFSRYPKTHGISSGQVPSIMLVIAENAEDEGIEMEMEERDRAERGTDKELGKEEVKGRERGREDTDEVRIPENIRSNQGSTISLYIQMELPQPDSRANNVSRLLLPSMRELFPLKFIYIQYLVFDIVVTIFCYDFMTLGTIIYQ